MIKGFWEYPGTPSRSLVPVVRLPMVVVVSMTRLLGRGLGLAAEGNSVADPEPLVIAVEVVQLARLKMKREHTHRGRTGEA